MKRQRELIQLRERSSDATETVHQRSSESEASSERGRGELEEWPANEYVEDRTRHTRRARRARPRRASREAFDHVIVEEPHAENEREEIEEPIVPGQRDRALETREEPERHAPRPPRAQDEERHDACQAEDRRRRQALNSAREVVCVPAHAVRQGLRRVVMAAGGEISPRSVSGPEDRKSVV